MPPPPVILARGGQRQPRRIEYEGSVHEFPGDFTDQDIARALRSMSTPSDAKPESGTAWPQEKQFSYGQTFDKSGPARAGGAAVNTVVGGLKGLASAALHPVETFNSIMADSATEDEAARDAQKRGDTLGTLRHSVQSIPIVGPTLRGVIDRVQKGEIPELAGEVGATIYAPKVLSSIAGSATKGAASTAKGLRASAETQYSRVLNATTKGNKARSSQVVPELVDRGVTAFSLKGLKNKASAQVNQVGQAIGDAWDNLPAGTVVNVDDVLSAIKGEAQKLHTIQGAKGVSIPKGPEAKRALQNIDELAETIKRVGEPNPTTGALEIPADKLRDLRQYFDRVSKQAGRFEGRALSDVSTGEAHAMAADAIRAELGKEFPDIAALNKEFHFWKDVERIASDTLERRQGQAKPLGRKMAGAAGAAAGMATGGVAGAVTGKVALEALEAATTSPAWGTVSATLKDRLAKAIAKGNRPEIEFYAKKAASATRAAAVMKPSPPPTPIDTPRLVASNERERR